MSRNKHFRPAKEFRKKGMTVDIRFFPKFNDESEKAQEMGAKAVEQAIKALRDRMNNEGIIREMKERSFYQSKGLKNRKAKAQGIMREKTRLRDRMKREGY